MRAPSRRRCARGAARLAAVHGLAFKDADGAARDAVFDRLDAPQRDAVEALRARVGGEALRDALALVADEAGRRPPSGSPCR